MSAPQTYHLLGAALDGWPSSEERLFAWSVRCVVDGFLPHDDYLTLAARQRSSAVSTIDARVALLMELDLNPVAALLRGVGSVSALVSRWNGFNRAAPLGVETIVDAEPNLRVVRTARALEEHAEVRKQVSDICVSRLLAGAKADAAERLDVGAQMRRLGLGDAAVCDLVAYLYSEPASSLDACVDSLGCARRTLQRSLGRIGVSFNVLRQAVRITIACDGLRTSQSLTDVAQDAGFFDSAHFIRAWKQSAGLTPSRYRALLDDGTALVAQR